MITVDFGGLDIYSSFTQTQTDARNNHRKNMSVLRMYAINVVLWVYYTYRKIGSGLSNKNLLSGRGTILSLLESLYPLATDKKLIRMGPAGDGGYLVPDDLEGIEACFSPGVGQLSGFEKQCAELGMKIYMADGSVDNPGETDNRFFFIKKFIGPESNEDFITMDDWVSSNIQDSSSDLLLQMDIEAHEYDSILGMPDELLDRFRIIIIEFHRLYHLWDPVFLERAVATFEKLHRRHSCVHIHPNNCCSIFSYGGLDIPRAAEFTFLRNDRFTNSGFVTEFPNTLDEDNMNHPHIVLPECWHASNN